MGEGDLEVDGVIGSGGLDHVVFEDGFNCEDRPDLGSPFRYDRKSDLIIVEANPDNFTQ